MEKKPTVLFIYDHQFDKIWKDGLWAALEILKRDFKLVKWNLHNNHSKPNVSYDFALGWGGFSSSVDIIMRNIKGPKGLCLGGYGFTDNISDYDVLFYECEWAKKWFEKYARKPIKNLVHAFGVNSDIYYQIPHKLKIYDYLSVGSFSLWKRHTKMINKKGARMVIGEIQKGNPQESYSIILPLLQHGVAISDMVDPILLSRLYNVSKKVYIPAEVMGGGERAVLEARACGVPVEIESDNPKLKELLDGPIYDHNYYADQLKQGILDVIF